MYSSSVFAFDFELRSNINHIASTEYKHTLVKPNWTRYEWHRRDVHKFEILRHHSKLFIHADVKIALSMIETSYKYHNISFKSKDVHRN